jgi:hypothetical protein
MKFIRVFFLFVLFIICTQTFVWGETVFIPIGNTPKHLGVSFTKPIFVTLADGTKHVINKGQIQCLDSNDAASFGFSSYEASSLLEFFVGNNYLDERYEIKSDHYFLLVPLFIIKQIIHNETSYSLELKFIDGINIEMPLLKSAGCDYLITGEEDFGEFGIAKFNCGFFKMKMLELPIMEKTSISNKSKLKVIITELGGRIHELSNARIYNSLLNFYNGESMIELTTDKIKKIDYGNMIDKYQKGDIEGGLWNIEATITLRTGTSRQLIWKDLSCGQGVIGKISDYIYEFIPLDSIKTIEIVY